jgi:hypothetical protein
MSESRNVSNLMIGDCDGCPQGTSIGVLTLDLFFSGLSLVSDDTWRRHVARSNVRQVGRGGHTGTVSQSQ